MTATRMLATFAAAAVAGATVVAASPAAAQEWVATDLYAVPVAPAAPVVEDILPATRYVERAYDYEYVPPIAAYSYPAGTYSYYAAPADTATVYVAPRTRYTQVVPAASSQGWIDYCTSKYRSFDLVSGTYLGLDGLRHACR
jgi:hypothetical protein